MALFILSMIVWWIITIILAGFLAGLLLTKKISDGKFKERAYTKLTLWVVMISFMSLLINAVTNIYVLEDTKEALRAQAEGIAPVDYLLEIRLVDEDYNKFFPTFRLAGIYHDVNFTFRPSRKSIRMYARNKGQSTTGQINFYLKPKDKDIFYGGSVGKVIGPLDYAHIEFDKIRYKECFGGQGESEWRDALERCDASSIQTGLMDWILKVDFANPLDHENPQCYSFKICIYNESQGEGWCKSQWKEDYFDLNPIDCPEPWF